MGARAGWGCHARQQGTYCVTVQAAPTPCCCTARLALAGGHHWLASTEEAPRQCKFAWRCRRCGLKLNSSFIDSSQSLKAACACIGREAGSCSEPAVVAQAHGEGQERGLARRIGAQGRLASTLAIAQARSGAAKRSSRAGWHRLAMPLTAGPEARTKSEFLPDGGGWRRTRQQRVQSQTLAHNSPRRQPRPAAVPWTRRRRRGQRRQRPPAGRPSRGAPAPCPAGAAAGPAAGSAGRAGTGRRGRTAPIGRGGQGCPGRGAACGCRALRRQRPFRLPAQAAAAN